MVSALGQRSRYHSRCGRLGRPETYRPSRMCSGPGGRDKELEQPTVGTSYKCRLHCVCNKTYGRKVGRYHPYPLRLCSSVDRPKKSAIAVTQVGRRESKSGMPQRMKRSSGICVGARSAFGPDTFKTASGFGRSSFAEPAAPVIPFVVLHPHKSRKSHMKCRIAPQSPPRLLSRCAESNVWDECCLSKN